MCSRSCTRRPRSARGATPCDGNRIWTVSERLFLVSCAKYYNRTSLSAIVEIIDLFLTGGAYRAIEDGVVLELFGRTRHGEAIVARYYGFRPYFGFTDRRRRR